MAPTNRSKREMNLSTNTMHTQIARHCLSFHFILFLFVNSIFFFAFVARHCALLMCTVDCIFITCTISSHTHTSQCRVDSDLCFICALLVNHTHKMENVCAYTPHKCMSTRPHDNLTAAVAAASLCLPACQ